MESEPTSAQRTVNGIEYRTDKAVLLANDDEWEPVSWGSADGEQIYLYRSYHGEYFVVYQSIRDNSTRVVPLNRQVARDLFRRLPIKHWDEEHAFRNLWSEAYIQSLKEGGR